MGNSEPLTADTITDDQLRALLDEAIAAGNHSVSDNAREALSCRFGPEAANRARQRCAEAVNAGTVDPCGELAHARMRP
jgi:hypothetical protein